MLPAKTTVLHKISKNTKQTSTATILEGFAMCDTVIYKKKHIFGIGSSQSFQNPWSFLMMRAIKVSFVVLLR